MKDNHRAYRRLYAHRIRQCIIVPITFLLFIGIAGCPSLQPPDFQLNLNTPQIDNMTVTVNGGVVVPVTRIQWEWGDGTIDRHSYFPATHTYTRHGRYTITVTVFDDKNFSASKSVTVDLQP
ncbi:MAG: PKD domain-containing protein [Desulfobacterota bacterium]|nr:PKD domain-containing protein [Thermodesulfobacteriota bacterium]